MSGSEVLKLLAQDVRQDTLQILGTADHVTLTWVPAGTSNHILWHSGHALWLQDLMCVEPLLDVSELPKGWAEMFGMNSQPTNVADWPTQHELQRLLESQLDRMLDLLHGVSDTVLSGAAPRLGGKRNLCGWILHGLHDEAKHSGEMYLLWKTCRAASQ